MADMEKEKMNEESMDDSMFSMYSDWAENGYVDAGETGYEQEMSAPPVSEETEKRQQVLDESQQNVHLEPEKNTPEKPESQQDVHPEPEKNTPEKPAEAWNPFETLVKIVEKNAPEEAEALKEVQQYMEEMDKNLKSMRSELDELKRQLAEHPDSSGLGGQAVKNLEKNADGLEAHNKSFIKNIFQKAAQVIRNFKAKGVIALNGIVEKLGIKQSLMEDRKYYLDNAAKMQKSIDKLDAINFEIQAAKSHFKNIGRLAVGKEALQPPQDKENIIITMVKAPHTLFRKLYQKMADKSEKRITRLENLEQKAAQARSTLGKLSDYKKESSAREAEKKEARGLENTRKEPELAI